MRRFEFFIDSSWQSPEPSPSSWRLVLTVLGPNTGDPLSHGPCTSATLDEDVKPRATRADFCCGRGRLSHDAGPRIQVRVILVFLARRRRSVRAEEKYGVRRQSGVTGTVHKVLDTCHDTSSCHSRVTSKSSLVGLPRPNRQSPAGDRLDACRSYMCAGKDDKHYDVSGTEQWSMERPQDANLRGGQYA